MSLICLKWQPRHLTSFFIFCFKLTFVSSEALLMIVISILIKYIINCCHLILDEQLHTDISHFAYRPNGIRARCQTDEQKSGTFSVSSWMNRWTEKELSYSCQRQSVVSGRLFFFLRHWLVVASKFKDLFL